MATLVFLSGGVAACSTGATTGDSSGSRSFSEIFSSGSKSFAQATTPAAPNEPKFDPEDCPPIDIRSGASSLSLTSTSRDPAQAGGVRYQVNIAQSARECRLEAGNLNIRVGMQVRVIVGQAGGPGTVDVPVRFALVQEGVTPKTLWTKLYKVQAVIVEGQTNTTATLVEENLTVPMPNQSVLDAYVIYIGFDPLGAQHETGKKKPPAGRRTAPSG